MYFNYAYALYGSAQHPGIHFGEESYPKHLKDTRLFVNPKDYVLEQEGK